MMRSPYCAHLSSSALLCPSDWIIPRKEMFLPWLLCWVWCCHNTLFCLKIIHMCPPVFPLLPLFLICHVISLKFLTLCNSLAGTGLLKFISYLHCIAVSFIFLHDTSFHVTSLPSFWTKLSVVELLKQLFLFHSF